ncbi:bifunctional GrpB family protein/GNAT family N-acetyltransferase [Prosthecobacter sp.]|uniref:bifunctional GrpB family protein/GNAT family N-acetyltransferase n=1 Tax=Prosthecobacter sp. TaxID=1965333 RepID=UPI002ABC6E27|nr:bifunctional GrpB family protein/GNAT family N-acetyltransferase [Prosthecobacter sp.]MDZ4404288.1 bifunctional GrpB family protein/GNAT family N-acetyltransferase [Prosthecobacter sp.]
MRYQVVTHNPEWKQRYASEADQIIRTLHGMAMTLHHIGSTAIPGISAKPIIDILMEVDELDALDARRAAMERLEYEAKGEFGILGRRYFHKNDASGIRTHQVHAFQAGSTGATRHLAFRDYMIAHPVAARAYSSLKESLALQHPDDFEAYMDGKDAFIKEHEARAVAWNRERHRHDCIETERTRLRLFEDADAEHAFTWLSDPEVMRFIPSGPDATLDDTRRRIAAYRAHQDRHGFSKQLIIHRESSQAIGDAGLYHLPDGKRIELGFRIAKSRWAQGYAVEVGRAWLAWFDTHLADEPLFADVHPDHRRSQRVLEKLGFCRSYEETVFGMSMLIYTRR